MVLEEIAPIPNGTPIFPLETERRSGAERSRRSIVPLSLFRPRQRALYASAEASTIGDGA